MDSGREERMKCGYRGMGVKKACERGPVKVLEVNGEKQKQDTELYTGASYFRLINNFALFMYL